MEGTFSYWMRTNLKDAYSGLITQDVDFVIIIDKKIYFIEEKNRSNARIGPAQKVIYKMICDLFKNSKNLDYEFKGVAIINIENEQTSLNEVEKLINESIRKEIEIEDDILNKLWDCRGRPFIRKTEEADTEHQFLRKYSGITKFTLAQKIIYMLKEYIGYS